MLETVHPVRRRGDQRRRQALPAPAGAAVALALALLAGCTGPDASSAGTPTPSVNASPSPTETLLTEESDDHSDVGGLAEGFPETLLPVPDGAEVLVSSAEPIEGTDLTEVSLNLRSGQDAAELMDVYRTALVAAGFTEAPADPDAVLAAQSTFVRSDGAELVVVGVLDRDDIRTLTAGGRVRVPS